MPAIGNVGVVFVIGGSAACRRDEQNEANKEAHGVCCKRTTPGADLNFA